MAAAEPAAPEPQPPVEVEAATSCEYRRVGDDLAILTVEIPLDDAAVATAARLFGPGAEPVAYPAPTTVALQPDAGLARLVFVVDRQLPAGAGNSLEIVAGPRLRFTVPAPVERPPVGSAEAPIGDAAVSTLAGEELFGLIAMLEKRCAVAERVADDLRAEPTNARNLAQAYREIWEVRALLDSREETYRRSADAVEAADAARREQEAAVAAVQSELSGLRETVAGLEAAVADAEDVRDRLSAVTAESDELAHERDEAQAAAELLGTDLEATRAAVDEWSAEAERARTHLAAAVARAEELEAERDEALAVAIEYETAMEEARGTAEAAARQAGAAAAELTAALAQADALQRERDEAYAGVDALKEQIDLGRIAVEEAESRLAGERALYEARIVAGVESERRLHLEVEELKARLGEKRKARSGALRPQPGAIAASFVNARQAHLRQTTLDQQRAEVAALESQLERLKLRSADPA